MAASGGGGGGASSGAIKAGKAYVELGVDDRGFKASLSKVAAGFKGLSGVLKSAGGAFVGAGTTVGAGFVGAFKAAIDRGVDFDRLSKRVGVPVEQLSAFAYAAGTTGQSIDDLSGHFENFAERVYQASQGTGEAAQTFARLGINAAELIRLNPAEQMIAVADAMKGITNDTARRGILSSLGSDQFQGLNDLFKQGSGGIRALMAEAGTVGAVVGAEEAKQATAAWRELSKAWTSAKSALVSVGAALLPQQDAIREISATVVKASAGFRAWIAENRETVAIAATVTAGVVALGVGLGTVGVAIAAIGPAVTAGLTVLSVGMSAAVGTAGLLAAGIGAILSPVGILAAGVIALGLAFVAFTDSGRGALEFVKGWGAGIGSSFGQWLGGIAETAKETWGGVVNAFKSGDLRLAAKIAFAGLNVEFQKVVAILTDTWVGFKDIFVDTWKDGVAAVKVATSGMLFDLTKQLAMSPLGQEFLARFTSGASRVSGWVGDEGAKNAWLGAHNEIGKLQQSGASPDQIGKAFDKLAKADADGILADRNRQRDADHAFRRQQIADSQKAIADAQAELRALSGEAGAAAAKPKSGREEMAEAAGKLPGVFKAAGQFGGDMAKQTLGGWSVEDKVVGAIKKGAEKEAELLKGIIESIDALDLRLSVS